MDVKTAQCDEVDYPQHRKHFFGVALLQHIMTEMKNFHEYVFLVVLS